MSSSVKGANNPERLRELLWGSDKMVYNKSTLHILGHSTFLWWRNWRKEIVIPMWDKGEHSVWKLAKQGALPQSPNSNYWESLRFYLVYSPVDIKLKSLHLWRFSHVFLGWATVSLILIMKLVGDNSDRGQVTLYSDLIDWRSPVSKPEGTSNKLTLKTPGTC